MFALTLAEHSGFDAVADAVARTMTPPPSYSRHAPAPPKLTLLIPDAVQKDTAHAASPVHHISPDATVVETIGNSPMEISPSRQPDGNII